jgi:hypothetical protein
MEGTRQAAPRRSARSGRCADIRVPDGDHLHYHRQNRKAEPPAGAGRSARAPRHARTDHPAAAGLVGPVRFLGGLRRGLVGAAFPVVLAAPHVPRTPGGLGGVGRTGTASKLVTLVRVVAESTDAVERDRAMLEDIHRDVVRLMMRVSPLQAQTW